MKATEYRSWATAAPDSSLRSAAGGAQGGTDRLERFERISRLAARLFRVPVAWVVDDAEEQLHRFVQHEQVEAPSAVPPAPWDGTAHSKEFWVCTERAEEPSSTHAVMRSCGFRFMACHALTDGTGRRHGTLVLADRRSRTLTDQDRESIGDLARTVAAELSMTRQSATDDLTGLLNRSGFLQAAQATLPLCHRFQVGASLLYFDLDGFKHINDSQGHGVGDAALRSFAEMLQRAFRSSDLLARFGGDEFVVLLSSNNESHPAEPALRRLHRAVTDFNQSADRRYRIVFSVGAVPCLPDTSLEMLIAHADASMYEHKKSRRRAGEPGVGAPAPAAEQVKTRNGPTRTA